MTREWATGKMDKAINQAAKSTNNPEIDTEHHKLSKSSVIEKVYDAFTASQWGKVVEVLDLERGSGVKGLKSLGSNLVLGPNSGKRYGEKGGAFDPNMTQSGVMTPRSKLYDELDVFMKSRQTPNQSFTNQEFDYVLGLLERVEKIHFQKTGGELVDADISMWQQGSYPDGKTWMKIHAPDYQVDEAALEGKTVRELKLPSHRAEIRPPSQPVTKTRFRRIWSMVTPYSMPLDQDALDRWKEDGYTRWYSQSHHSWMFGLREDEMDYFMNPDFVLAHFPDTPEMEQDLYGFTLLRPNF